MMCCRRGSGIKGGEGRYEIRVEGQLDATWSAWFDGMDLTYDAESGSTVLAGLVPDQSALHGLFIRIRDLHLILISVRRLETIDQSGDRTAPTLTSGL